MYLQVETRTSSRLHLKRAPGIRSWSLLVGILSIGLAAAYYSGDSLGWKLFYVTGCLFVAVQNLEDWEEAIFDKSTGKVVLKTFSLYKKLLTLFRAGHDQVVVLLHDVRDVSVEEEKVRYFGKGYMVVLRLATGFSHPLTQSAVMGHRRTRGTFPVCLSPCTARRTRGTFPVCLSPCTARRTRGTFPVCLSPCTARRIRGTFPVCLSPCTAHRTRGLGFSRCLQPSWPIACSCCCLHTA
ncbi:C17orf62 isoform 36 [Pan troglodytes]|uniref:Essential for reactive oxygen species protein n=1 Tax=Pan troglodytes TaxID=9598 RepID=A0A2J8JFF3_PANTR|nr:C17orf62 isoform 36 [Pan troglodytes]